MTFDVAAMAWWLVDVSLRSAAVAALVAVLLRAFRIRTASVRHAAWTAVLAAMLLMPVLTLVLPALWVPVPAWAGNALGRASNGQPVAPPVAGQSNEGPADARALVPTPDGDPLTRVDPAPTLIGGLVTSRSWLSIVMLAYAAGVLFFVSRLLYGWVLASALIRRATRPAPIGAAAAGSMYQSPDVTTPVTVGVLRPVIVLPLAWTRWDADTLAAIVAHETAHLHRRDGLINVVAHLNRAIFWFHPLAWWLERTLACTAEHACDDVAARTGAGPTRYAEILVEMADVVRRSRGRRAWHAVGVSGPGRLDDRIDRLLCGDAFASTSMGKKMAVSIGCVLTIAVAAACRQQTSAAPLREDPALATQLANQRQQTQRFEAARDMTQEQADALEQRLAVNPDDFDLREQLVTYYRMSPTVAWNEKVPGLRRHALWLVEHHPEHRLEAPPLSPEFDPEGFAAVKRLWEAHLSQPGHSAYLLFRAARFFALYDKPYAEQLLHRGLALDPDSSALRRQLPPQAAGYTWPAQLASLYASALNGWDAAWGDGRARLAAMRSPYAMQVRDRLEATRDAQLLARVGGILARPSSLTRNAALNRALDEVRALGVRYLERALAIEPGLQAAKAAIASLARPAPLLDIDRLANRALEDYMVSEDITEYARKDPVAAKRQRDEAAARAANVLTIAAAHKGDPAYSAAVMTAHHVLATAALRDGDRERAFYHLHESVQVPSSERIQHTQHFSWLRPVSRLLEAGERDRVAAFLEAFADLTVTDRDRLLDDTRAIREGRMPAFFQRQRSRSAQP